mgnify:FL=1
MFAKHALTLLTASTLAAPIALAGHHEGLQPPAETGQVVVTYRGTCPSEAIDSTLEKIQKIIAYERANSPVLYASSPGVWADGKIGAVDIHKSQQAMEDAFAWQSSDKTWSDGYADIAANCGITVEEFEVSVFTAR